MIVKHSNSISCEIICNWYFFWKTSAHSKVLFLRYVYICLSKTKQTFNADIYRIVLDANILESDYFNYYVALGKKNERRMQFGIVTILSGWWKHSQFLAWNFFSQRTASNSVAYQSYRSSSSVYLSYKNYLLLLFHCYLV